MNRKRKNGISTSYLDKIGKIRKKVKSQPTDATLPALFNTAKIYIHKHNDEKIKKMTFYAYFLNYY